MRIWIWCIFGFGHPLSKQRIVLPIGYEIPKFLLGIPSGPEMLGAGLVTIWAFNVLPWRLR